MQLLYLCIYSIVFLTLIVSVYVSIMVHGLRHERLHHRTRGLFNPIKETISRCRSYTDFNCGINNYHFCDSLRL